MENYQNQIVNIDPYLSSIKENGFRITSIMASTITVLYQSIKYHSPKEIQVKLSAHLGYCVGLPTVYRTLNRLLESNIIFPMYNVHLETLFCLCRSLGKHLHHFICKCCKQVLEINHCVIDEFEKCTRENLNASVTNHIVQIELLCSVCRT